MTSENVREYQHKWGDEGGGGGTIPSKLAEFVGLEVALFPEKGSYSHHKWGVERGLPSKLAEFVGVEVTLFPEKGSYSHHFHPYEC